MDLILIDERVKCMRQPSFSCRVTCSEREVEGLVLTIGNFGTVAQRQAAKLTKNKTESNLT